MTIHLAQITLAQQHPEVRRDLANPYNMHRTLCRAAVTGQDQLTHFLWRHESLSKRTDGSSPVLLVQSNAPMEWNALSTGYLLSCQERRWDPASVLQRGRRVAFRLRANPTVHRVPQSEFSATMPGQTARGRRKRLGLWREADQLEWLQRKAQQVGLAAVEAGVSQAERLRCRKGDTSITLASALFDGRAVIADPLALVAGLHSGIGHGRMLGHGLLSLSPLRT